VTSLKGHGRPFATGQKGRTVRRVVTPTEAQRLKAARVLADVTVPELAKTLDTKGLGAKTLGAIERGERQMRPHETALLAKALDVPEWFLTDGLAPPIEEPSLAEKVERLEYQMQTVLDVLAIRGANSEATPRGRSEAPSND
jgi:transcriptional regulator with XRE-family HTH domain